MNKITITSSKYDGTLRDEYETFWYAEDADSYIVYSPPGTIGYDHRTQSWFAASDGLLERYFKTRWYTVWHICEQQCTVNQTYIHLAMPATMTATGIAWVDLDIDYRVHQDGRIERLDEDEYHAHRERMGYPTHVQDQVQAACVAIEALAAQQLYPFNHATHVALYQQIKARE